MRKRTACVLEFQAGVGKLVVIVVKIVELDDIMDCSKFVIRHIDRMAECGDLELIGSVGDLTKQIDLLANLCKGVHVEM